MSQNNSADAPFTLVFYYVPEDKDELATPNAFAVNKPLDNITLADIEDKFPLEGEFLFRFKYLYQNQKVWLDLSNKKCNVPKCDKKIIMKVTRKVAKYLETSEPENQGISDGNSNNVEQYFRVPDGGNGLLDFWIIVNEKPRDAQVPILIY